MNITRASLTLAAERGVLSEEQASALWDYFNSQEIETPAFRPAHILYYVGGLIAIGAMTLFLNMGWERFGGMGLLLISLGYIALALVATNYLLNAKQLAIPAGIIATLAVALVPLAVYGAQVMLGFWPAAGQLNWGYHQYHVYVDWRWILMEFATLFAGAIALWRYRLPFMVMPIAVTLWYMSMDLVPMLLGGDDTEFFSSDGRRISMFFGLGVTLIAFYVDVRARATKDYAFWLYIFGVMAFWGGLSTLYSDSEFSKLVYCAVNVALIAIGAALSRRVFAVFGGLGLAFYLSHLASRVFSNSILFPLVLTGIGLGVIAVGVYWQRHERELGERLRAYLPPALRELVERRAA